MTLGSFESISQSKMVISILFYWYIKTSSNVYAASSLINTLSAIINGFALPQFLLWIVAPFRRDPAL